MRRALLLCLLAAAVAALVATEEVWVTNELDDTISVVDVETRRVVAQVDVGIKPEGMAVSPDGRVAVTTSETTNMAH